MKVALLGYGKMGHEIEKILISRGHEIVLVIDKDNANDLTAVNLKKADVAIEFSTPITAFNNIIASLEAGVRVVCGTTAWIEKLPEVVEVCKKNNGAFFYASNYSVGVNLFFKINASLAKLMNRFTEYDVTLNEVHHTQKKDAPSGTAITLAEGILSGCKRKKEWYLGATTQADILEVTAQRRSVVPGTHTVVWESEVDSIVMEHTAKSRAGFAVGAVLAAEFLIGRKGVFGMDDLLFEN
ncbi:MAG: 4-hydroxy-tetrahydrodipicolinate reductase [Mucinivorans sp.]